MRLVSKLFLIDVAIMIILVLVLIFSTQTTTEQFILPTEGSQEFPLDLKQNWYYQFEVSTWSGDETMNISITRGEETIFFVLLEGKNLEYDEDPEMGSFDNPLLGNPFGVDKTDEYRLVIHVIDEPTQKETQLVLVKTNQRVLGFDSGLLIISIIILLLLGVSALFAGQFYNLIQTIRKAVQNKEV